MRVQGQAAGGRGRLHAARRILGIGVAGAGFILSPLSWWNDLVVNIPIAVAAAKLTSPLLGVDEGLLFAIYYWATNVLGIVMMIAGSSYTMKGRLSRRSLAAGMAASIVYTVAVLWILG